MVEVGRRRRSAISSSRPGTPMSQRTGGPASRSLMPRKIFTVLRPLPVPFAALPGAELPRALVPREDIWVAVSVGERQPQLPAVRLPMYPAIETNPVTVVTKCGRSPTGTREYTRVKRRCSSCASTACVRSIRPSNVADRTRWRSGSPAVCPTERRRIPDDHADRRRQPSQDPQSC